LCSKTFYATGNCTGQDELAILRDDKGWPGAQLVKPWVATPIRIVGVEIMVTHGPSLDYAFAGNSATPDVMLMVGAGARWGRVFYPAGLGFALPGAGSHSHIDLHISCGAGEPPATARAPLSPPKKRAWWKRLFVADALPAPPQPPMLAAATALRPESMLEAKPAPEWKPHRYQVFYTLYYQPSADKAAKSASAIAGWPGD
jgi:hypothetical protein